MKLYINKIYRNKRMEHLCQYINIQIGNLIKKNTRNNYRCKKPTTVSVFLELLLQYKVKIIFNFLFAQLSPAYTTFIFYQIVYLCFNLHESFSFPYLNILITCTLKVRVFFFSLWNLVTLKQFECNENKKIKWKIN